MSREGEGQIELSFVGQIEFEIKEELGDSSRTRCKRTESIETLEIYLTPLTLIYLQ